MTNVPNNDRLSYDEERLVERVFRDFPELALGDHWRRDFMALIAAQQTDQPTGEAVTTDDNLIDLQTQRSRSATNPNQDPPSLASYAIWWVAAAAAAILIIIGGLAAADRFGTTSDPVAPGPDPTTTTVATPRVVGPDPRIEGPSELECNEIGLFTLVDVSGEIEWSLIDQDQSAVNTAVSPSNDGAAVEIPTAGSYQLRATTADLEYNTSIVVEEGCVTPTDGNN